MTKNASCHPSHLTQVLSQSRQENHVGPFWKPWNLMHSAIQLWWISIDKKKKNSKQHIFDPYHLWCICYQSWFPMFYVPDPWLSQEPWQQPVHVETNNRTQKLSTGSTKFSQLANCKNCKITATTFVFEFLKGIHLGLVELYR